MTVTLRQWPTPANFLTALPTRAVPTDHAQLPSRIFTEAERLANLERLREMMRSVGLATESDA